LSEEDKLGAADGDKLTTFEGGVEGLSDETRDGVALGPNECSVDGAALEELGDTDTFNDGADVG